VTFFHVLLRQLPANENNLTSLTAQRPRSGRMMREMDAFDGMFLLLATAIAIVILGLFIMSFAPNPANLGQ